jgi:hypothetical protein
MDLIQASKNARYYVIDNLRLLSDKESYNGNYLRINININIKTIIDDINGANFLVSFGKSSIKGSVKGLNISFNRNGDTAEQEINGNIKII